MQQNAFHTCSLPLLLQVLIRPATQEIASGSFFPLPLSHNHPYKIPANVATAIADSEYYLNQYEGNPLSMTNLEGKNAADVGNTFLILTRILAITLR